MFAVDVTNTFGAIRYRVKTRAEAVALAARFVIEKAESRPAAMSIATGGWERYSIHEVSDED